MLKDVCVKFPEGFPVRGFTECFVYVGWGVFPWRDELELNVVVFKKVSKAGGELKGAVAVSNRCVVHI